MLRACVCDRVWGRTECSLRRDEDGNQSLFIQPFDVIPIRECIRCRNCVARQICSTDSLASAFYRRHNPKQNTLAVTAWSTAAREAVSERERKRSIPGAHIAEREKKNYPTTRHKEFTLGGVWVVMSMSNVYARTIGIIIWYLWHRCIRKPKEEASKLCSKLCFVYASFRSQIFPSNMSKFRRTHAKSTQKSTHCSQWCAVEIFQLQSSLPSFFCLFILHFCSSFALLFFLSL